MAQKVSSRNKGSWLPLVGVALLLFAMVGGILYWQHPEWVEKLLGTEQALGNNPTIIWNSTTPIHLSWSPVTNQQWIDIYVYYLPPVGGSTNVIWITHYNTTLNYYDVSITSLPSSFVVSSDAKAGYYHFYIDSWINSQTGYSGVADISYNVNQGRINVTSNQATPFTISGPANISGSVCGGCTWTSTSTNDTIPLGSYTITWGDVTGYTKPTSTPQTISAVGQTITFNGVYTVAATTPPPPTTIPPPSMSFSISPNSINKGCSTSQSVSLNITNDASSSNVYWMTTGGVSWTGGTTPAPVGTSTQIIVFPCSSGYLTMVNGTAMPSGTFQTALYVYTTSMTKVTSEVPFTVVNTSPPSVGTISVASSPTGASFTIAGPNSYNASGTAPQSFSNVPAGAGYTITWGDMAGYTKPLPQTLSVGIGLTTTFNGNYVPTTGTIIVNSTPLGADFTVTGSNTTTTYTGTTPKTYTATPPDTYTVTWEGMSGYSTPQNASQPVVAGGTATFNGNFTACLTSDVTIQSPTSFSFGLGQPVSFTATASNSPTAWEWDWGDSTTFGNAATATHTYTVEKTYTLSVRAQNGCGWGPANSKVVTITSPAPVASIVRPDAGLVTYVNEAVSFQGQGSTDYGTISGYEWNFGDGSPLANTATASHTYTTENRNLTAQFRVLGSNGKWSEPVSVTIHVYQYPQPTASITQPIANMTFPAGAPISFSGACTVLAPSTCMGDGYFWWEFGDIQNPSGPQQVTQNTQHIYLGEGTWSVKLKVQSDRGVWSTYAETFVRTEKNSPKAYIDTPSNSMVFNINTPIQFNGSGTTPYGIVDGYKWQFGDGSIGSSSTMNHTYTSDGTKIVNFYVKNSQNVWSDVASVTIVVLATKPVATISQPADNQEYFLDSEIQYKGYGTASGTGQIVGFKWDFGDTEIGNSQNSAHKYAKAGTYKVKYYVKDSNEKWSDPMTINVIVKTSSVKASIVTPVDKQKFNRGAGVTFQGFAETVGGTIVQYEWNFGDGTAEAPSVSSDQNPSHKYYKSGLYTVSLRAQNSLGIWSDPKNVQIEIKNNDPVAAFTIDPKSWIAVGDTVTIRSVTSDPDGDKVSYKWLVNDREIAETGEFWTFTGQNDGKYNIKLVATDEYGAIGSFEDTLKVGTGAVIDEGNPVDTGQKMLFTYGLAALVILALLLTLFLLFGGKGKGKRPSRGRRG